MTEPVEATFDVGLDGGWSKIHRARDLAHSPPERMGQHHCRSLLLGQLPDHHEEPRVDLRQNICAELRRVERDRPHPISTRRRLPDPVQVPTRICHLLDLIPVLPRPTQRIHSSNPAIDRSVRRNQRHTQPRLSSRQERLELVNRDLLALDTHTL